MGNRQAPRHKYSPQPTQDPPTASSAHVKPLPDHDTLTKAEKEILTELWEDLKRHQPDFCKTVWFNALRRGYKIKELFDLHADCNDHEILESSKVRRATWGVQRMFEEMIVEYNLDFDVVCHLAADMGARHADYYEHGIQATYWDIFALSLVEEYDKVGSIDDKKHQRNVIVWRKFVNLIIDCAAESYHVTLSDPKGEKFDSF